MDPNLPPEDRAFRRLLQGIAPIDDQVKAMITALRAQSTVSKDDQVNATIAAFKSPKPDIDKNDHSEEQIKTITDEVSLLTIE